MKRYSTSKKIVLYLIMICLTFGVTFVALEFGLARYYYSSEAHDSEMEFDSYLGWRLKTGMHSVKPDHSFLRHALQINQYHLRNKEVDTMSQKSGMRVIVLGDSFTLARAVPDAEIFTSRLETLLSQRGQFEVINAGVSGFGTAQEMLLMKQLASQGIVGDIYVLMVFVNDILDNLRLDYGDLEETAARPGFVLQQNGTLVQKYYPKKEYSASLAPPKPQRLGFITVEVVKRKIASLLQSKPKFVKLLNRVGIDAPMPRMPGLINGWYREEILEAGIPLTKELLREIQAEARSHHATLLVAMIPSPIQVYSDVYDSILKETFPANKALEAYFKDKMRPQTVMGTICQDLKIPYLDLYPSLISNVDKDLYIPLEGHFTTEGHALVAQQVAHAIATNPSDPESGSR
jgi:lysophospholipase L1-like esterase